MAEDARKPEKRAQVSEPKVAAPTVFDLFVTGYDEVTFEKDPLNPEQEVIVAKKTFDPAPDMGEVDPDTGQLVSYVPDPPCIMPFEADERHGPRKDDDERPKLDQYWKNHAGWLEYWPNLKEHRDAQQEFRNLWQFKAADSRIHGFVVVSINSVGVRFRPGMDEDQKNGQVLRPGQCVGVEAIEERDNNRFLKLPGPGAGWVFERKGDKHVMQEMKAIETGMWWFKCTATSPVEVRKTPTWNDSARSGFIMNPKEVVVVNIQCKIHGYTFFHLFDGRGWVFQLKPGSWKNDKTPANIVMASCDEDFHDGDDWVRRLVPPTNKVVAVGLWTYIVNVEPVMAIGAHRNGFFLQPGSVVKVDKRANSNGNPAGKEQNGIQSRVWLRLGDGNGWVPETDERGKKLMLFQQNDEVTYPNWFRPGQDANQLTEPWMSGVV